jgi:hypothetical protein
MMRSSLLAGGRSRLSLNHARDKRAEPIEARSQSRQPVSGISSSSRQANGVFVPGTPSDAGAAPSALGLHDGSYVIPETPPDPPMPPRSAASAGGSLLGGCECDDNVFDIGAYRHPQGHGARRRSPAAAAAWPPSPARQRVSAAPAAPAAGTVAEGLLEAAGDASDGSMDMDALCAGVDFDDGFEPAGPGSSRRASYGGVGASPAGGRQQRPHSPELRRVPLCLRRMRRARVVAFS